jgi:hypothetical protein
MVRVCDQYEEMGKAYIALLIKPQGRTLHRRTRFKWDYGYS